jgi:very-short-patch-repair endonuclease
MDEAAAGRARAEDELWTLLRARYGEGKFRRHHNIGPFAVDFACLEAKLVVEVRALDDDAKLASERTSYVERAGWRLLPVDAGDVRAENAELFAEIDAAL